MCVLICSEVVFSIPYARIYKIKDIFSSIYSLQNLWTTLSAICCNVYIMRIMKMELMVAHLAFVLGFVGQVSSLGEAISVHF